MIFGLVLATVLAAEVTGVDAGHAYNPAWSADGQWLAFELNRYEGQADLYVVKIQGGNPLGKPQKVALPGSSSAFAAGGGTAAAPTWHPQGLLVFEGNSAAGKGRLYFWKPGGQGAAELLSGGQVGGDLSWPTVSPDGKYVSFISDITGSGDVYTWDRSANAVNIAMPSSPWTESAPRYNADASKLAFSRKNQGGEDLYTFGAGQTVPWMSGAGDQSRPTWAAGHVVYFTNERGDDHWDIAVSSSANEKRILARDVRLPLRAAPAISPDGRWVAYGASTPEKAHVIYFTSLDGAKTVQFNAALVACGEPALVKAGERTLLAYTALPSAGADWRALHVADVTDLLK